MKNWKTTVGGVLASVGLLLAENDNFVVSVVGKGMEVIAFVLLGYSATDKK